MRVIEGFLADVLEKRSRDAMPQEAVGLLTNDDYVIMLPNAASDAGSNFAIRKEDLLSALRTHEIDDLEGLTLWHSHPSGGVGPSRVDMQQKVPFMEHLVVTLTDHDVVFTWY